MSGLRPAGAAVTGTTLVAACLVPWVAVYADPLLSACVFAAAATVGALAGFWACRSWGRVAIFAAVLVAAGSAMQYDPDAGLTGSTALVLPARLLLDAWQQILTVPLPVPAEAPLLALPTVLAATAAAVTAVCVRRGLLRLWMVAPIILWVVGLVLGVGAVAPVPVCLPMAAALTAAVIMHGSSLEGLRVGRLLGAAVSAVLVAAVAVPMANALPLMPEEPVDPREHVTPPTADTVVVNPLDTLVGQIRSTDTAPLFTATIDSDPGTPFWSLAALDTYDGASWMPGDRLAPVAGSLPDSVSGEDRAESRQQVTIYADLAPWVPHLGTISGVDTGGLVLGRDSGILLDPQALGDGSRSYEIEGAWSTAELPALRAAAFAPAPAGSPLLDSSCLPADVAARISEAVAGTSGPFDKAAGVVAWVREDSGLVPNREAITGHSCSSIRQAFEQVAETGSAPASIDLLATVQTLAMRSQDIPARLAVGYRVPLPAEDGTYAVLASDATAYTQIKFDGPGWIDVAAEPPGEATDSPEKAAAVVTASGLLESVVAAPAAPADEPGVAQLEPTDAPSPKPWVPIGLATLVSAVLLASMVPVVQRIRVLRRRRRRRSAPDPRARVAGAWAELLDALRTAGLHKPGRSAMQTASALQGPLSLSQDVVDLACLVEGALYDPSPMPLETSDHAWALSRSVSREVARLAPRRRRILHAILPTARLVRKPA